MSSEQSPVTSHQSPVTSEDSKQITVSPPLPFSPSPRLEELKRGG
ncbi:Transaldolase [Geitlerinema sp. FC II]|nr:Transaldolase [Geitlerinema sp. FC II]